MKRLDAILIARFDAGTTWLQRRGGVPLNHVVMADTCLFWALGFTTTSAKVFIALFAAMGLAASYARWSGDNGYQENARKALACNARSLWFRERMLPVRLVLGAVFFLFLLANIVTADILVALHSISFICLLWLDCCRYLGPGDFAREKRSTSKLQAQGASS
jgi:hypothetical protein